MRKKNAVIGAGVLALMLLAGCQSVSDQIGKTVAEGVIGQAVGGDVKIDEKSGNMTIKTKDGEASVGSGDTRPASAPADLPSLPNAKNFSWLGNEESGIFNYEIDSADFKATCKSVYEMASQAGWTDNKNSFNIDSEDSMMKSMNKDGKIVTIICGKDSDGAVATISMSYGKDTSKDANGGGEEKMESESESGTEAAAE